jgi:signal transduction histidine kinase
MTSDIELTANAMPIAPGRVGDVIRHAIGVIQGVFRSAQGEQQSDRRRQQRCTDCARIANELHHNLFQGFLGASMLLHQAVEQTPTDAPSKLSLERAIHLVDRAVQDGRLVLQRLPSPGSSPASLEQALSELRNEFPSDKGVRFRMLVTGKPKALNPGIREQIFLIGREAVVNALRHSGATNIEVEVEYLRSRTRVLVRDDGCGIDPKIVRSGRNSHWGLRGMRDRAESIGAQFRIWSKRGAGTEIEICVSTDVAKDRTCRD